MTSLQFGIRDFFWAMVVVAVVFAWRADRFIYQAREESRLEYAATRDWQATTLWEWANRSDFVEGIENDDSSITITTKDGKAEVFTVPPHLANP